MQTLHIYVQTPPNYRRIALSRVWGMRRCRHVWPVRPDSSVGADETLRPSRRTVHIRSRIRTISHNVTPNRSTSHLPFPTLLFFGPPFFSGALQAFGFLLLERGLVRKPVRFVAAVRAAGVILQPEAHGGTAASLFVRVFDLAPSLQCRPDGKARRNLAGSGFVPQGQGHVSAIWWAASCDLPWVC